MKLIFTFDREQVMKVISRFCVEHLKEEEDGCVYLEYDEDTEEIKVFLVEKPN